MVVNKLGISIVIAKIITKTTNENVIMIAISLLIEKFFIHFKADFSSLVMSLLER
jgi:hypothetical protein